MAVDVAQLGLKSYEPNDDTPYVEAGSSAPPPKAGRFNGQAPATFEFKAGGDGQLVAVIDPIKLVGQGAGYDIRFTRVSNKNFKRGQGHGNTMTDYLRAQGIVSKPKTHAEYASLVEQTANRTFPVEGDWDAYCKDCQWSLSEQLKTEKKYGATVGYDQFPSDGNGGRLASMPCPHCSKQLRANLKLVRYVSTVSGS